MVFRARTALVPVVAGCLTMALSGCTVEDYLEHTSARSVGPVTTPSAQTAKRTKFSFSYSGAENFVSKKTSEANGDGTGQFSALTTKGPFQAKLPAAARRLAGGARSASGSFVARYDGTWDRNTNSGTTTGVVLLTFSKPHLGELCFVANGTYSYTESPEGLVTMNGTGTFKSAGGTGKSSRQRTTGTWTQTVTSYPEDRPDDFSGSFSGAYKPAGKRALAAACQELVAGL